MNWKSFSVGFVAATALVGGPALYGLLKLTNETGHITLPRKQFIGEPSDQIIQFQGSLGGAESIAYPNNLFQGICYRQTGTCEVVDQAEIAPLQMGTVTTTTYAIKSWSPDLIIATNDDPLCVTIELRIRPKQNALEYLRSPKAKLDPNICRSLERRTMIWSLENPPGWGKPT